MDDNDYGFPWLDDEHWAKAVGQFRMKVGAILNVFNCYGMGVYIDPIVAQIVDMAIDFSMRTRGDLDHHIGRDVEPVPRPTE